MKELSQERGEREGGGGGDGEEDILKNVTGIWKNIRKHEKKVNEIKHKETFPPPPKLSVPTCEGQ